jgi:predicted P-loop ATPase
VDVRHDVFANKTLIDGLDEFGPELNDLAVNRLRAKAESVFNMVKPSKDMFHDALSDIAWDNRFHPVCDYLDEQQRKHAFDPNSTALEEWVIKYGGAPDTPYVRAVSKLWLIAAVRRVRKPGCKFDEMLVFVADQGTDKSGAFKVMAVRDEWFGDSMPLGKDPREVQEALAGHWIVECAELDGLTPEKDAKIKAMLSRQRDKARAAFGRIVADVPRQSVVGGTTNNIKFLFDPTGNRRYWPATIVCFDLKALAEARDALWAEAAHREAAGESIRLDPKLYAAAAAEQKVHTADDPWQDKLAEVLGERNGIMRTSIVWDLLGVPVGTLMQKHGSRVGTIMKALGWVSGTKKIDGKKVQVYRRGFEDNTSAQPDEDKHWIRVSWDQNTGMQVLGGWTGPLLKVVDNGLF